MDPNLFHMDWERLIEVLVGIVVLAFFLERALAVVFEHRLYIKRFDQRGLKEVIALVVGVVVCRYWEFDAISVIFLREHVTFGGELVTGAIVAGGSKASIRLFRGVLGFMSDAERERQAGMAQRIAGFAVPVGPPTGNLDAREGGGR